jgi:hypothetical protein
MDIPALVRRETDKIISGSYQFGAFSAWHINTGWCYELSRSISDELTKAGIENEILDSDWLIKRGPNEGRPKGVGLLGYHEFVLAEGKYYDSEAPEGVESPYHLPIVQAAIVSRQTEKDFTAFLKDPNSVGSFPCPVPMREAFIENLKAYAESFPADEKVHRAVHVAAQMIWEPVHGHLKEDPALVAETFVRILNSWGLACEVETGDAPAILDTKEEHSWVRFEDGTIFEVNFDRTALFDRSKLGGRVRVVHPLDELNNQYTPANSLTPAM